ncbi:hypothetical protein Mal64_31260 [Pseudobythopirellula maris]|uniref:B12-binding N-terminal domain-containing protein n=2 Tax=Pseudobythopirellula maris TaxID=2527991 RepID=A0A5C5ZJL4_9BACT|nr:hypothetical protein Mal64_31260 [Pseudobythopirellula maris]
MDEVVRFVRLGDHAFVRPDLLGLPARRGPEARGGDQAVAQLQAAVRDGDAALSNRLILDHYLGGADLATVFDEVLAPAMHAIGEEWECGETEVFQERRACEIFGSAIHDLKRLLPPPALDAPIALGGAPEGDHYHLASQMVDLVLTEAGWRSQLLGGALPFATLSVAAQRHQPPLFWLSMSHVGDPETFWSRYRGFVEGLPDSTRLLVGGRAFDAESGAFSERVTYCEDLRTLARKAALPASNAAESGAKAG